MGKIKIIVILVFSLFLTCSCGISKNPNKSILKPTIDAKQLDKKDVVNNGNNTVASIRSPQAAQEEIDFYGIWKVGKEIAYSSIISEEESNGAIGRVIEYNKNFIITNGKKEEVYSYVVNNVSKNDFEERERTMLENLGINGNSVIQVQIEKRISKGKTVIDGYFYYKDKEHLILPVGGTFFEMVRE